MYERLGIPSVATVRWAADQVLRKLLPGGSEPQWRDPTGAVQLLEMHVDRAWVGTKLSEIETAAHARIPFISRFGTGMVPTASTVFQDGDLVYVAVGNGQVNAVEDILGAPPVEH